MTNICKKVAAIIILTTMLLIMSITALASANKPYTTYYTTINHYSNSLDSGYSYISKCSCNPVDNYLYAGVRVQYREGTNYYNDPVSQYVYYYSDGNDVSYRDVSCYHYNINYAWGYFKARCYAGGGPLYVYSDSATP